MPYLREFGSSRRWGIAFLFVAVLGAAQAAPARRPAVPQCPSSGTTALFFARGVDGQSFVNSDGGEIRLAGVLAPGAGGETLAESQRGAARNRLAEALQEGRLEMTELGRDRYGRIIAHVFAGGTPVAPAMLRAGALRTAPDTQSGPCASAFLEAESEARTAGRGHWGDGLFAMRDVSQIRGRLGTFQIVEGTVVSASLLKGRAFINFGADYKTDFTVTIAPADMRAFRAAKLDVKTLAGKRVRVRGWVELYNGPEMEIASPAAIETLD